MLTEQKPLRTRAIALRFFLTGAGLAAESFTLSCGLSAPLCNAAELSPHCVAASDARIPSFVVEAEAAFEQRVIAENAFSVLRARGARASHQSAALPLSSCGFPMACASYSL